MDEYDFLRVESETKMPGYDYRDDDTRPSVYVLGMFPYPSGQLHIGHLRNYAITDVLARFKRARGFNVLHPIGWDAFGLPAENAARLSGTNPAKWTLANIEAMTSELKKMGISYNWNRSFATCDPGYYKHEQEFFVKLFRDGIAYKKMSTVNWDPVDNTVLANEQVINGRGWRSGALIEKRSLSQWFLRISDYAEELLNDLDTLTHWPEAVKNMQREWIGKSEGCEINFKTTDGDVITVFTTRPETIFGASFCAIAVDHPLAVKLAQTDSAVKDFTERYGTMIRITEKDAISTGIFVVNPLDHESELPVYIANFVLSGYGTGAIFGCPAHDERDRELAMKFGLPIKRVVDTTTDFNYSPQDKMINSNFLTGYTSEDARQSVTDIVRELKIGCPTVNYKLKDWGVSRQRYWGCPIPVIYCEKCGTLPADDIPVTLPDDVDFTVHGNPLDHHPTWKHVKCYKCGADAVRETDTFDTFMESSWYFAAFCSEDMSMNEADKFLPVDYYVGGIEHAILHLLYARYYTRLLNKYNAVKVREPFERLITQGMVCHKTYCTSDGTWLTPGEAEGRSDVTVGQSVKMSKSKKNIVTPSDVIARYGADAARLFVLSDSPVDKQLEWSDSGLEGSWRFLRKLWDFVMRKCGVNGAVVELFPVTRHTHLAIAAVTNAIEALQYNVCIAKIREFFNFISGIVEVKTEEQLAEYNFAVKVILRLLEPFTPYITQALWNNIGYTGYISETEWPVYDPGLLVEDVVKVAVQISGVTRGVVTVPLDAGEEEVRDIAMTEEKINKRLEGKVIKKVIFIKNRAINFVV